MATDDVDIIRKNVVDKGVKYSQEEIDNIKEIFDLEEYAEKFPDADFEGAKNYIDNMDMEFTSDTIEEIKKYMFNNNEWNQFDPNNVAVWERMREGTLTEVEETLLKHERLEMVLKRELKEYGIEFTHDDAHFEANMIYDFAQTAMDSVDFPFEDMAR
jgi:hypothetical protein